MGQIDEHGTPRDRRERGSGGLYRRNGIWWIKYYVNGKPVRESTGTNSKIDAQKLLTNLLADVASGEIRSPRNRELLVSDLYEAAVRDYEVNRKKSIRNLKASWNHHLCSFFGHLPISAVTAVLVRRYVTDRIAEGAANATINLELAYLKRMYTLAAESCPSTARSMPAINKLKENNVRIGFLTDEEYDGLAAECDKVGIWLRCAFEVGYTFGWRKREVLGLLVRQIDFDGRRIFLDPGTTKNKEGRVVKFARHSMLESLLAACCRDKGPSDFVITRPDGKPIRRMYKIWCTVCCAAGLSYRICRKCETRLDANQFCELCNCRYQAHQTRVVGFLFHDLRRTASRNARTSGVSENVIMKMGGWKTRSMFDRYAIVAEGDLDDAIKRIEARRAQNGHSRATAGPTEG